MATVALTAFGSLACGAAALSATVCHRQSLALCKPTTNLRLLITRKNPNLSLKLKSPKPSVIKPFCSSSFFNHPFNPKPFSNPPPNPPLNNPFLSNWNETLAALFALSLSLSSKIAQVVTNSFKNLKSFFLSLTPQKLQTIQFLQDNVLCSVAPSFCAAYTDRPIGYLKTPLTVVASVMAKWLDIYNGVLMVRIFLSWFPNFPWDRQPLSAIRDLCDPYLIFCRTIFPPIFDTFDVSPLFAFLVLGTLHSILNGANRSY